jgi:adenosylcobinamide-GDP ribazoletransferase
MRLFKSLALAFAFMTRLPIPIRFKTEAKDFGWMPLFFPLTSLAVGFSMAVAYSLFLWLDLNIIAVISALIVQVVITGALHVDGFIDCADAFFGGMTKEKRLAILKDSHVGALGIIAAIFLFFVKAGLLLEFNIEAQMVWILLLLPVAGKIPLVMVAGMCDYARDKGKGQHVITLIKSITVIFVVAISAALLMMMYLVFNWRVIKKTVSIYSSKC